MSLSTRLDKLEAALRGRDGGTPNEPLIFFLHHWAEAEGCPIAFQPWEVDELSPRFQAIALDNLVAAGKISECDRGRVRFIRRVLAYPHHDLPAVPCSCALTGGLICALDFTQKSLKGREF